MPVRAFQTEGEYRTAALDRIRKQMCFFSVKICKPIPVLTHYESENDHHMSPLRQIECWARASQKRLTRC